MQPVGNDLAKFLQNKLGTRRSNGIEGDYFSVDEHFIEGCDHKSCSCSLIITGKAPHFDSVKYCVGVNTINYDLSQFFAYLQTNYRLSDGVIVRNHGDYVVANLRAQVPSNSSMKFVDPPFAKFKAQESIDANELNQSITKILRLADRYYFQLSCPHLYPGEDVMADVWRPLSKLKKTDKVEPVLSLSLMCLRKMSIYRKMMDRPLNRRITLSAMANLDGAKATSALLKLQRQHDGVTDKDRYLFGILPHALDVLYNLLKTRKMVGNQVVDLSLADLEGMYLGASAGLTEGTDKKVVGQSSNFVITSSGKKYEMHQADVESIMDFLDDAEKEPAVNWSVSFKNEHYYYHPAKYTVEEWEAKLMKVRIFMIPSSVMIIAERLVSKFRMHVERGDRIRIGGSWAHGGADHMSRIMSVTPATAFDPQMGEGDIDGMDVSVALHWIEVYLVQTLIYDDMKGPFYPARKRLTLFLIKNICAKLLHLYHAQWVQLKNVVPSGCLNTSHMDSWILLLWWILFVIHTIKGLYDTNYAAAVRIEELLVLGKLPFSVYGDDHLSNKTMDPLVAPFINETAFALFCKDYLNVMVRDVLDGIPFCSVQKNGHIITRGATILKHQFILNPIGEAHCVPGKQPMFLPYRETWDVIVRCVYGREPKERQPLDIVLSTIGHAYGTYAANRDAYNALSALNRAALDVIGLRPGQLPIDVLESFVEDDYRDLRRKGLSPKELLAGFPAWHVLEAKNVFNPSSHNNTLDGHMATFFSDMDSIVC